MPLFVTEAVQLSLPASYSIVIASEAKQSIWNLFLEIASALRASQ
jgi:hypothetical protein